MISTAELNQLKKRLKPIRGFRRKIHELCGFSLKYIDSVLRSSDDRYNSEVIDAAFEVLKEHDEKEEKKKEERKQLLKKKKK
jgi:hypothetical protein